jgi:translation initiation factor IF-3
MTAFPNIDPRIHAVGVSKLRAMDAAFLKDMGEDLYLIQSNDEPLAVIISYGQYLAAQQIAKEGASQ